MVIEDLLITKFMGAEGEEMSYLGFKILLLVIAASLISACGGGSGGDATVSSVSSNSTNIPAYMVPFLGNWVQDGKIVSKNLGDPCTLESYNLIPNPQSGLAQKTPVVLEERIYMCDSYVDPLDVNLFPLRANNLESKVSGNTLTYNYGFGEKIPTNGEPPQPFDVNQCHLTAELTLTGDDTAILHEVYDCDKEYLEYTVALKK